jgi:moderate conductance mechanosensitive channel
MPSWFPRSLAETFVFVPLRIIFLIILAIVARLVLHHLINRSVRKATGRPPQLKLKAAQVLVDAATLPAERREQRIQALGSLGRSTVTFVILIVTVLMILAELGFNITTIVAGTSVVAITLGFGLQSLVKDLVSGIFMLVEDQLGIGDYVDMEKASGAVEAVGLRVTQLRDQDGNVWYVRNGEVLRVGNFSQGGTGRPVPAEPQPT